MFELDRVYNRRRDIHALYGGNWQSGICPSRSHPFIFIFSGGKGHTHGYSDLWVSEDIYAYTGEGQVGDMEFTRGNLALLNHLEAGKRIFFFEAVGKGLVQYKSELELHDFDYQQGKDREGNDRQMIIFYFKKVGVQIRVEKPQKIYTQPTIETLVTEKETTIKSRVGQGAYRTSLIYRWDSKCAVSGVGKQELLIASTRRGRDLSSGEKEQSFIIHLNWCRSSHRIRRVLDSVQKKRSKECGLSLNEYKTLDNLLTLIKLLFNSIAKSTWEILLE